MPMHYSFFERSVNKGFQALHELWPDFTVYFNWSQSKFQVVVDISTRLLSFSNCELWREKLTEI